MRCNAKPLSQSPLCWAGEWASRWETEHLVFLPSGMSWNQHKAEDWGKGGAEGGRVVWSTSLAYPRGNGVGWGGGGFYSVKPPADTASRWTIHQQANQTDLEQRETRCLWRCREELKPQLLFLQIGLISVPRAVLLSGPAVLKRFLQGWSHCPLLLRSRTPWASSSVATGCLNLRRGGFEFAGAN